MSSATVSGTDVGGIASQNNTAAVRPHSVETEPPYLSFLSSEALVTYHEVKQRVLHSKGDDVPTHGERHMLLSNRKFSLHLCSSLREAAPDGTWDKVVESYLDPPFTRLSDLLPVPDDVCESCLSNVEGAFLEATRCVKRLEDLQMRLHDKREETGCSNVSWAWDQSVGWFDVFVPHLSDNGNEPGLELETRAI